MKQYGVPNKFINLVKMFYTDVRCSVVNGGGLSDWFSVKSGVKQGCVMSGFLFLMIIDWIMTQAVQENNTGIKWTLMQQLEDLDYADDIALLASEWNHLQKKLQRIKLYGEQAGLKINVGKTKSMCIDPTNNRPFQIGETEIEEVLKFIYLGGLVTKDGGAGEDIRRRIGQAYAAYFKLQKVWKSSKIFTKTKIRIFKSNVVSVLLYGCESWRMTRGDEQKLDVFLHTSLRRILKISWEQHTSNDEVRRSAGVTETLSRTVQRRRWTFIGHILRRDNRNLAKNALTWTPEGKRKRGRPKETYRRTVERERQQMGFNSWSAAAAVARDRGKWKDIIASSMIHQSTYSYII